MPDKVVTLASTTSSQAELEHAASDNWRTPFVAPNPEPKPEENNQQQSSEPAPEGEQGKSAAAAETAKPGEEKPHTETKNGWQKRVDRLTARNKSIETENATLRARLDEIERKVATPAPKADPAAPATETLAPGEPDIKDFKTPNEWLKAHNKWSQAQEQRTTEQAETEQRAREVWDAHNSRLSEARAKYDDFDDVAKDFGNVEIPRDAAIAIVEDENSADILYYLAKNEAEAKKLATLSPMKQIAEVGRIADKVRAAAAAPAPKTPLRTKPQSQAPEPIKPVGGSTSGSTVPPGEMSIQDYKRYRAGGGR